MGAIRWGTRPPTFSDSEDIICHVFLFRFRNVLVSHQAVPFTFYNKIALMPLRDAILESLAAMSPNVRRTSGT